MKVGIASDHRGYHIKEKLITFLKKNGFEVFDYGTNNSSSVDYPKYAFSLCEDINSKIDFGILICGTGIGMSIAANKVKGIRCAKTNSLKETKLCREHNNANVLALSSNLSISKLKKMSITFLKTNFSNLDKHEYRNRMVDNYVTKL